LAVFLSRLFHYNNTRDCLCETPAFLATSAMVICLSFKIKSQL